MKKRVISFMMSAVLTLSGLGCYGLANVHAETDTNVERKLKIFAHYAEAEKPILDYAISKVQEKYPNVTFEIEAHPNDDGQTLKTRAATGDMPDIAHVNAGDVESLSASGSLLDVAEYVKDTGYEKHIFSQTPELLQFCSITIKRYSKIITLRCRKIMMNFLRQRKNW